MSPSNHGPSYSSSSNKNNSSSSNASWREKIDKARKLHRPSLKNWQCDGMHVRFPSYLKQLEERRSSMAQRLGVQDGDYGEVRNACECFTTVRANAAGTEAQEEKKDSDNGSRNTRQQQVRDLPIVASSSHLSVGDFIERCEKPSLPAIIRGVPTDPNCWTKTTANATADQKKREHQHWPAVQRWTLEELDRDDELRERCFKVGEDDDGRSVKLKLKHFLKYVQDNKDDSPLYIFDSNFDEDRIAKKIMDQYQPPPYFNQDLFHLVGERRRPPYRWFLVGPQRSGTTVHIDPLATSAWNTLIVGKKRWVLFPPDMPKSIVKGRGCIGRHEDDEPVHYFLDILPRMKEKAALAAGHVAKLEAATRNNKKQHHNGSSCSFSYPQETFEGFSSREKLYQWAQFTMYEFTQLPGETVFIPHGWWHAVLNLTDTIGITQNFCSTRNFDFVWRQTRTGRKKMAAKWLGELDDSYPELAKRAREINVEDGFVMKYAVGGGKKESAEEEDKKRKKKDKKKKHHKEEKQQKSSTKKKKLEDMNRSEKEEAERKRDRRRKKEEKQKRRERLEHNDNEEKKEKTNGAFSRGEPHVSMHGGSSGITSLSGEREGIDWHCRESKRSRTVSPP